MEFIIALVVVAIFWYLAYKAWNSDSPCGGAPDLTVLIAHDHKTGKYYQEKFGLAFDRSTRIVTTEEKLRGYGPDDVHFIYVNSDNGQPNPLIVEQLRVLESRGAEVDWVGFE